MVYSPLALVELPLDDLLHWLRVDREQTKKHPSPDFAIQLLVHQLPQAAGSALHHQTRSRDVHREQNCTVIVQLLVSLTALMMPRHSRSHQHSTRKRIS